MESLKLRGKIAEANVTQGCLAKELGISENSFSSKIQGKRPFSVDEAKSICDFLRIDDDAERAKIFLR